MDELSITVDGLRDLLESQEPVTLLDVRPASERAEWAIPGSLHVDCYHALRRGDSHALQGVVLPPDRLVVTICGAGRTSLVAAQHLHERGLDARSLEGGMKAWSLAWNLAEQALSGSEARIIQVRRTGKGCLSYLIGSGSEAAVVDPALDPAIYLTLAARYGWTITHILETHLHADHLSRSRALAEASGATLYLPSQPRATFAFSALHEGDTLMLGQSTLRVLHTPGHTLESSCYLLDDQALLSGDTLFLTGVGRPDLEASAEEAHQRARLLYHSLQRLLRLPPGTLLLPGHTSAPLPFDGILVGATLGQVYEQVPLLREQEAAFVAHLLAHLPPTPPNHAQIVALNEAGFLPPGDPTELEAGANRCAVG